MNAHSLLGLICLILTLVVGGSGFATAGMMAWYDGDPDWAERDKVFYVARFHRYISYFMLILGNGVCSGGVATYFAKIGYGVWGVFGISSSFIFLLLYVIHEYILRRFNSKIQNVKLIEGDALQELIQKQNLPTLRGGGTNQ